MLEIFDKQRLVGNLQILRWESARRCPLPCFLIIWTIWSAGDVDDWNWILLRPRTLQALVVLMPACVCDCSCLCRSIMKVIIDEDYFPIDPSQRATQRMINRADVVMLIAVGRTDRPTYIAERDLRRIRF